MLIKLSCLGNELISISNAMINLEISLTLLTNRTKYSRMDKVKFVESSF